MTKFTIEATVLEPKLGADEREQLRMRLEALGGSDAKVNEDDEGRATVLFGLNADNEQDANDKGTEMLGRSLPGPRSWTISGAR